MLDINTLVNDNRKIIKEKGNFHVIEHVKDLSVNPGNAQTHYFMSQMGVRKRQLVITLEDKDSAYLQAGAMQWTHGHVTIKSGLKGAGDFLGKTIKGKMTGESAIKPEYKGEGVVMLEPTNKYILLQDVGKWSNYGGLVIEDGMFLACSGDVKIGVVARKSISSAVAGGEGLFNTNLKGEGIVALESPVPQEELIILHLNNETLKIDGNMAVAWSASLKFTVEAASKSLIGTGFTGEGLVNTYSGTGVVLLSPVADTQDLHTASIEIPEKG